MLTDLKYRVLNVIHFKATKKKKKKKRTLNIEIDQKLVCFSFFDIRTLTFFQVVMLINLVWHANRSQISCSQCYSLATKKKIEL